MKSIQLVEDDVAVADTIRSVLEDEAYEVNVFASATALPVGAGSALLITDLASWRGYSSAEAIGLVHALRLRTAAPIVVLTAHAAALADEALAREVSAVLTKPFEIADLLDVVERFAV